MTGAVWRLDIHDELGSTQDEAIRRAEAGSPARLAVLARRQTKGRGSRGRSWTEPPAGNLAVSMLLRPRYGTAETGQVVFRAALALIEALDPQAGRGTLMLKWPNDVLFDGRKLAGILVESAFAGDRLDWLVIGCGANLVAAPDLPGVACLAEGGAEIAAPETVAQRLFERLDHWLDADFATVRTAWLARAHLVGTPLIVDGTPGEFRGLAPDGALLFADGAALREVATGQVFAPTLAARPHAPT